MQQSRYALMCLILAVAACAPGPSGNTPASPQAQPSIQRTLVMLNRGEPPTIAAKPLQAFSGSIAAPIRLFNAMLDYKDENEAVHPYLAEAAFAMVDSIDAADPRTVVVRWKQPYIEADRMFGTRSFAAPMPRHLLEHAFGDQKAGFTQLPYWSSDFVGRGRTPSLA